MRPDAREILLDPSRLTSKNSMAAYLNKELHLPDYFGGNLDALADCLGEISEDIDFILTRDSLITFAGEDYAYLTLKVISACTESNPHLRILIG